MSSRDPNLKDVGDDSKGIFLRSWRLESPRMDQLPVPETNRYIAPENRPRDPKGNSSYSKHPFSGLNSLLVSGSVPYHLISNSETMVFTIGSITILRFGDLDP